MTRRTTEHPDLTRPDATAPFFSTWRVGTPERQRATVEAIAATWLAAPYPAQGPLAYYVYTGHDGTTLLHHSQWVREEDYEEFVRTQRQGRNDRIDAAAPGIERVGLHRYRRYRSHERAAGDTRTPGLVVTVRVDFEDEEGAADRRREWVDLVLAALAGNVAGDRGLISAHFHLSQDGTHVLNYAEWESEEAYDKALADTAPTPEWERVRAFPGMKGAEGSRYTYALGLVPG
ncbi:antibiotic biosynthesis monooxygenase [Streptomyces poonensis]|uniref:Antibiotic biosynthesis monooxygenase n=1 Tax=Streptomyces poonensis TaxID=68255 RepID=A0A918Q4B8_9ACTN|nr:antibiotic biosynthesis monooxygenase [Streptomyces poonensis]GGZ33516.1 antibiotic biosynthesis monooxygenase [Streptomyces poonensis]GLJ89174.1 antibiotic biosynthesis monooxygenase [Streptomyces poonensis]